MTEPKRRPPLLILAVAAVTLFGLYRVLASGEAMSPALTLMSWTLVVLGALGVVGLLLMRK